MLIAKEQTGKPQTLLLLKKHWENNQKLSKHCRRSGKHSKYAIVKQMRCQENPSSILQQNFMTMFLALSLPYMWCSCGLEQTATLFVNFFPNPPPTLPSPLKPICSSWSPSTPQHMHLESEMQMQTICKLSCKPLQTHLGGIPEEMLQGSHLCFT